MEPASFLRTCGMVPAGTNGQIHRVASSTASIQIECSSVGSGSRRSSRRSAGAGSGRRRRRSSRMSEEEAAYADVYEISIQLMHGGSGDGLEEGSVCVTEARPNGARYTSSSSSSNRPKSFFSSGSKTSSAGMPYRKAGMDRSNKKLLKKAPTSDSFGSSTVEGVPSAPDMGMTFQLHRRCRKGPPLKSQQGLGTFDGAQELRLTPLPSPSLLPCMDMLPCTGCVDEEALCDIFDSIQ